MILQISLHQEHAQLEMPRTMKVKNGRKMHALTVGAALATRHVCKKYVQFPAKIQLRSLESAALYVQVWRLT
jgi:hypothetical protein